jgi:hypothetical protein
MRYESGEDHEGLREEEELSTNQPDGESIPPDMTAAAPSQQQPMNPTDEDTQTAGAGAWQMGNPGQMEAQAFYPWATSWGWRGPPWPSAAPLDARQMAGPAQIGGPAQMGPMGAQMMPQAAQMMPWGGGWSGGWWGWGPPWLSAAQPGGGQMGGPAQMMPQTARMMPQAAQMGAQAAVPWWGWTWGRHWMVAGPFSEQPGGHAQMSGRMGIPVQMARMAQMGGPGQMMPQEARPLWEWREGWGWSDPNW